MTRPVFFKNDRGLSPQLAFRVFQSVVRRMLQREAEEVAEAVVYLSGDESTFTTGTIMLVDGGFAL